jgi:membrane-bound lytic murein transglycosylase A
VATTLLALLGCAAVPGAPSAIELTALPGWSEEIALNAAAAMLSGCRTFSSLPSEQELPGIAAGLVAGDWREPCRDLALASNSGSGALADALGLGFVALASQGSGVPALITGYYEPEIAGSRTKGGACRWPIYSLPEDHPIDRAQISAGALKGEGLELLYLKDPIDAFSCRSGLGTRAPGGRVDRASAFAGQWARLRGDRQVDG